MKTSNNEAIQLFLLNLNFHQEKVFDDCISVIPSLVYWCQTSFFFLLVSDHFFYPSRSFCSFALFPFISATHLISNFSKLPQPKKKGFLQPWNKLIVRSFCRNFDKTFIHHQELSANNSLFPNRRQFFFSALCFNAAKAEYNFSIPLGRQKPSQALKYFFNFQRNDLLPKSKDKKVGGKRCSAQKCCLRLFSLIPFQLEQQEDSNFSSFPSSDLKHHLIKSTNAHSKTFLHQTNLSLKT